MKGFENLSDRSPELVCQKLYVISYNPLIDIFIKYVGYNHLASEFDLYPITLHSLAFRYIQNRLFSEKGNWFWTLFGYYSMSCDLKFLKF